MARTSLGTHSALPREGGRRSHPEPHVAPRKEGWDSRQRETQLLRGGEWGGYVVVCAGVGGAPEKAGQGTEWQAAGPLEGHVLSSVNQEQQSAALSLPESVGQALPHP